MKYQFIKASWFSGTPFIWNAVQSSNNTQARIFRFGPILIRVEK